MVFFILLFKAVKTGLVNIFLFDIVNSFVVLVKDRFFQTLLFLLWDLFGFFLLSYIFWTKWFANTHGELLRCFYRFFNFLLLRFYWSRLWLFRFLFCFLWSDLFSIYDFNWHYCFFYLLWLFNFDRNIFFLSLSWLLNFLKLMKMHLRFLNRRFAAC